MVVLLNVKNVHQVNMQMLELQNANCVQQEQSVMRQPRDVSLVHMECLVILVLHSVLVALNDGHRAFAHLLIMRVI